MANDPFLEFKNFKNFKVSVSVSGVKNTVETCDLRVNYLTLSVKMPPKKSSFFKCKYQKVWEQNPDFKGWLSLRIVDGDEKAHCRFCHQDLRPHLTDLRKHMTVKKHVENSRTVGSQKSVSDTFKKVGEVSQQEKKKRRELRFALFCACKISFNALDPLTEIIQSEFGGKGALEMKRTKCQALVKNILAPFFQGDLLEDLKNAPFSLLVDEATDLSVKKLLGVSVIYYSKKMKKIVTTYLNLIELESADACGLEEAVEKVLLKWEVKEGNFVGLGTDGASVMVGERRSLQKLLKDKFPGLVHVKCSCHSIDLAAKEAVKKSMPSHLEYMLKESHNWFAHSSLRQSNFAQMVEKIGVAFEEEEGDEDGEKKSEESEEGECPTKEKSDAPEESASGSGQEKKRKVLKILSPSDTRWLVMSDCIERILCQFSALRAHFQAAYEKERCFYAKSLHDMYANEGNRLLLLFLHPILKELKQKTLLFQSNKKDPLKVFGDLEAYFLSLAGKILKNSVMEHNGLEDLCKLNLESEFCFLSDEDVNYGAVFMHELRKAKIPEQEKVGLKKRAKDFLRCLFVGLQKRLVGAFLLLKKIRHFALPEFLYRKFGVGDFPEPFFPQSPAKQAELLEICEQVQRSKWLASDTGGFWMEVHHAENASGENPYKELTEGVVKILCLPISNGEIERVFSQVSVIKDKKRNRMHTDLLEAVLFCKFGLRRLETKVEEFSPPAELCKYTGSSHYDFKA